MSINPQIRARLEASFRRQHRLIFWSKMGGCWAAAAGVGLVLAILERQSGWTSSLALPFVALVGIIAAAATAFAHLKRQPNWHKIAQHLEALHPDLEGRLLTAVQQKPAEGGELNYLQQRLIHEALRHDGRHDWSASVPHSRLRIAQFAHWLALLLFAITLLGLRSTSGTALLAKRLSSEVTVSPGDTELERGSTLVILA